METTAINLSYELRTEDNLFNNRECEKQFNTSTTSDEAQKSNTRKENIGNYSDDIVANEVITEDNIKTTASIIELTKDMDKNK